MALFGFLAWTAAVVWLDCHNPDFPAAIGWAFQGCCRSITPQVLNQAQPGLGDIGSVVRYVGPNMVSTGPYVVSISSTSTGSVAEVAQGTDGRCYAELLDKRIDTVFYAQFKPGTRCSGRVATLTTVRASAYQP